MPAYKLAAGSLDNLRDTIAHTLQQIRATTAFLEQMDLERSLTQDALLHNSLAEGQATAALRQADNLRDLVRQANGGRSRQESPNER